MVAVPGLIAVTIPFSSTEAISSAVLDHVSCCSTPFGLKLLSNGFVFPIFTETEEEILNDVTVTSHSAFKPPVVVTVAMYSPTRSILNEYSFVAELYP